MKRSRSGQKSVDPNKSATALRALKVLEVLADARTPVSAGEVAGAIGAERSTAYRMLATLMDAGYVERDPHTRGYRLGYKILTLSRPLLRFELNYIPILPSKRSERPKHQLLRPGLFCVINSIRKINNHQAFVSDRSV